MFSVYTDVFHIMLLGSVCDYLEYMLMDLKGIFSVQAIFTFKLI